MHNMNFSMILAILTLSTIGFFTMNYATAQVDPLTDIGFLQTGEINTFENQFHISNDLTIREFFNGNIIRVSGQTIEGFPYITYSKILDDQIDTRGMIFINGEFVNLTWTEKDIQTDENIDEKQDDLAILVQYTQRVHSKHLIQIDIKIFDEEQNKLNNFYQNDGYVSNTNIEVMILDEKGQEYYSTTGTTDEGFYKFEYLIPDQSKRETLTATINAENEHSKSSKILQIFSLGNEPTDN